MTLTDACMASQLSLVITVFRSRNHGGLYDGGVKFNLHKKCDRRHDHGKCEGRETKVTQTYTNQIVDFILKTVRRHMMIRFKEPLSKLDETCSNCKHDPRSAKKIAVSIQEEFHEVALDQQWLMKYDGKLNMVIVNLTYSGQQLLQFQSPAFRAALRALYTPAGEVISGARRQPRDLILRVGGNPCASRLRGVPKLQVCDAMYNSIIGNANNDLKEIQAILVALRDNG